MSVLGVALAASFLVAGVSEEPRSLLLVLRNAHEENRLSLSSFGTIRFRIADGDLGSAKDVDGIDALLKRDWKRRSPSRGLYVFDGEARRYENLYPPEELVARRKMISAQSWSSPIVSCRLLSDGKTTMKDNVDVNTDGKSVLHTANCRTGIEIFFEHAEGIPLSLGCRVPRIDELGPYLTRLLDGHEGLTVSELDESAQLGGVRVVKLKIKDPGKHAELTYWVDLEHGAIPLRRRKLVWIPHNKWTVVVQQDYDDVRWVGRGWLPFRSTLSFDNLTADGAVPALFARETVVESANYETRPDPSMFALEFPVEQGVAQVDRDLGLGRRRVWSIKDFSTSALAGARHLVTSAPIEPPAMPGPREPASWGLFYLLIGLICLLAPVVLRIHRGRRHARA